MSSLPTRPKQTLLSKRVQKAPRERYDLEDPASVNLQSASLLMGKLPYDVRRMIYHELLSGLRGWLHINIHPNNITTDNPTESRYPRDAKMHVKCQPCLCENPKLRDEGLYEECCNGFWFYGHRVCSHPSYYSTLPTYDLLRRKYVFLERPHFVLNLLLSCRMIYLEFSRSFYSTVTFDLMGLHSARYFLTVTPNTHLDLIRSFQMEWTLFLPLYHTREQVRQPIRPYFDPLSTAKYLRQLDVRTQDELFIKIQEEERVWERTCQCLFNMKNLSTLIISIHESKVRGPLLISEMELLRPLMNFVHRPLTVDISIQLPWRLENALEPNEGLLPFLITRKQLVGISHSYGVGGVAYEEPPPPPSIFRRLKPYFGWK